MAEPGRQSVSACLIVRDEEADLPACLATVAFCDEIVVVDSKSADQTVAIAERAGARVLVNPWPGFAAQRNVAIDAARCDWILEVDADERITPLLRASIEAFLRDPGEIDCAVMARRNEFLGAQLGAAARYPEYRSRLVKRGAYRHDESRVVHEGHWSRGAVAVLEGDLEHRLAPTLRDALDDLWTYAVLESRNLAGQAVTPAAVVLGAVVRPAAKLGYRTVLLGGWRDGWRGLVKIALDCVSDALVWVLRAGTPVAGPGLKDASTQHFSSVQDPSGPLRIAVVAPGAAGPGALRWARDAQAAGADVVVLGSVASTDEVRVRAVDGAGPLVVLRALDAEHQVRAIDVVVAAGPRASRLLRTVPRRLHGRVGVRRATTDPAALIAAARAATGGSGA